jgi:hypothetical protein
MPLVGRSGKKRASGDGGCGAYLNGAIYALKGGGTQEFWKYGIADNSWLELDSMPRGPEDRDVGAGADIAAAGLGLYITRGNGTNELWQYLSDELLPPRPPSGGGQAGLPVTGRPRLLVAPNPLTAGGATVLYHLPHVGAPTLSIYNVAGQRAMLRVLAGQRGCVSLDLGHLSNGVYLVKLSGAGFSATQKLVVHK